MFCCIVLNCIVFHCMAFQNTCVSSVVVVDGAEVFLGAVALFAHVHWVRACC